MSLANIALSFSDQVEYRKEYKDKNIKEVISTLYKNLFNRDPDVSGFEYWVEQVEKGKVDLGVAALSILNGGQPGSEDFKIISNKLKFSENFTNNLAINSFADEYKNFDAFAIVRTVLSKVNADPNSVFQLIPPLPSDGSSIPNFAVGSITQPITILAANFGIGADEIKSGFPIQISLFNSGVKVGDTLQVLKNAVPFSGLSNYIITPSDIVAGNVVFQVPPNLHWGADGNYTISTKLTNIYGTVSTSSSIKSVILDSTPPPKPKNFTLITGWTTEGPSGLDYYTSKLKVGIKPFESEGGYAVAVVHGKELARDSIILSNDSFIEFNMNYLEGKEFYNAFHLENFNIEVILYDQAGNKVSHKGITDLGTLDFKYVSGKPATNLQFTALGGTVETNTINASNTGFKVSASIDALGYFNRTASLLLNGNVIATDDFIVHSDKTVDFIVQKSNFSELKQIVSQGGKLSLSIADMNADLIAGDTSINLVVKESFPTGTGAGTSTSTGTSTGINIELSSQHIQSISVKGQTSNQYNMIDARDATAMLTASISRNVATGGRAEFYFGSKLIATDNEIKRDDTSVDFLLGTSGTNLSEIFSKNDFLSIKLYNANNQMVSPTWAPYIIVNKQKAIDFSSVSSVELFGKHTPTSLISVYTQPQKEVFKVQVATSYVPSNTAKATLLIGSSYWVDGSPVVGKYGTYEFNFDPTTVHKFGMYEFSVIYSDGNDNTIQTTGDLRGIWARNSNYNSTYVGPAPATDVQFQAVGGNVLDKTFNASNTGLIASATINGYDYAGGRAELHFNYDPKPIATDDIILSSDTTVNFSLNSINLKSIINSDSKFSVWVYNASGELSGVHSEFSAKQDYRAPDAPRKIFVSDNANGTKNVELQITAMQSTNGRASLYVNNELMAQDNFIAANDGFIQFNLNTPDAAKLATAISAGNAEVKLFDVSGNFVAKNLQYLPQLSGSASSSMLDIIPPSASQVNATPRYVQSGGSLYSREVVLKFSEPVNKQLQLSQMIFANSSNMELDKKAYKIDSSSLIWDAAGTELTVRSGLSDYFFSTGSITIVGVQDLAGNVSDISFKISS